MTEIMSEQPLHLTPADCRRIARVSAYVGGAVAALALVGWALDIVVLKSGIPGFVSIKANSAVGLLLLALGLWASALEPLAAGEDEAAWRRPVAAVATLAAAAFGAVTLLQYGLGIDLQIDTLLWADPAGAPGTPFPGRMAPSTASALVLLGAALFLIARGLGGSLPPTLAAAAGAALLPATVEYLYGSGKVFGLDATTRISVPAVVGLGVIAVGTIAVRAEAGWAARLLDRGPAGRTLRRLIPAALAIPLAMGATAGALEHMQVLAPDTVLSFFTTAVVAFFVATVWFFAGSLREGEQMRQHAESAMRESEQRKAAVIDGALDCVVTIDHRGIVLDFNPAAEKTFGFSRDAAVGHDLAELLIPERLRRSHREGLNRFLASEETTVIGQRIEMPALHRSGHEFPVELTVNVVQINGAPVFTAYLRDITERVEADRRLRSSLEEKDVLLREVHHRVKNNLQVVSSLLNLEGRRSDDPRVREAFRNTVFRIGSIARLHERLYRTDSLASLDLGAYLTEVAEQAQRTMGTVTAPVSVDVDPELDRIGLDLAVPTGLVVGELVGNAVRHGAREGGRPVRIRVTFRRDGDRHRLSVEDDGPGFPEGVEPTKAGGLGLTLVSALARQLGGRIEFGRAPDMGGARVAIGIDDIFRVDEPVPTGMDPSSEVS